MSRTRAAADDSVTRTPVSNPRLSKQFREGEEVKVKKKDLPGYEDATIITKHTDGTYDVRFDRSGRDELKVAAVRVVKRPDSGDSNRPAEEGKEDNTLSYRMGQKVEAMYKGRGSFRPATILSVNSQSGTCDVKWEDGVEERGGKFKHIFSHILSSNRSCKLSLTNKSYQYHFII